jgi:hypothetical protein
MAVSRIPILIWRSSWVSALVLLAACGSKRVSKEACEQRADAIEARARARLAETDQLLQIHAVIDSRPNGIPRAEEGSADFSRGIVVPIRGATPNVLEAVAAAEACNARTSKQPVHLYFVAPSDEDAAVSDSAAWLALATKTWGISIEARRLVYLAREHESSPWPSHSEGAQRFARSISALKGEPRLAALGSELRRVSQGCAPLLELQKNWLAGDSDATDNGLALPRGLRACGCAVPDVDELEAVWHAADVMRIDIGWVPPPDDSTTRRTAAPLTCEDARDPIIMSVDGEWKDGAADMRPVQMGALDQLTRCRDQSKLDHSLVVSIVLSPGSDGPSTTIHAFAEAGGADALEECMKKNPVTAEVAQPSDGSERVLIYVPAARTAP